jgi:hypothetical protein
MNRMGCGFGPPVLRLRIPQTESAYENFLRLCNPGMGDYFAGIWACGASDDGKERPGTRSKFPGQACSFGRGG